MTRFPRPSTDDRRRIEHEAERLLRRLIAPHPSEEIVAYIGVVR